jgi:hypothetical protein
MNLDIALRATEVILSLAYLQGSLEHFCGPRDERLIFGTRFALCLLLLFGVYPAWVLLSLSALSLYTLHRFQGPYNGGSDRMGLLILYCLTLTAFLPSQVWQERIFGYLAFQLILSYFISGRVKIVNPDWRSGRALRDVFMFSAYPVSEDLRKMAGKPRLLWLLSWGVILFELAFPLAMLHQSLLILALIAAACFHFSNACFFGLNRFFWTWLAAYPSLLWLQVRLFSNGGF